jgi:hypothetical protein
VALFVSEKDGVIEVRQEVYGFTQTEYKWWYYDLGNRTQSSNGCKGDPLDASMSDLTYGWVTQYYAPRIAPYRPTAAEYHEADQDTQELWANPERQRG